MQPIKYAFYSLTAIVVLGMSACSKMDEYKKYTIGKERYYPQKIDSVKILSGKQRVILTGISADPKVSEIKVFWNLDQDSVEFSLVPATGIQTIREDIRLPEGLYDFRIFTYDQLGNKSVPVNVAGHSFDTSYQQSLIERRLKQAGLDGDNAVLEWFDAASPLGGVKVIYTDTSGKKWSLIASNTVNKMVLTGFKPGDSFQYATWDLPDATCVDTFYTDFVTRPVTERYEVELDRSLFSAMFLPGDASMTSDRPMPFMWDDDPVSNGHTEIPSGYPPQWFTFDLGVTAKLSRFNIKTYPHPSNYFNAYTMRNYEIWGSTDPNPDGSWDNSWTLLVAHECIKPSGLPLGELSDSDIMAGEQGDSGEIPLSAPPVRYIRIKCLNNWSGVDNTNLLISDLVFWGSPR